MTLPAGAKLGPYEILAPIGAGGMGEVYRARDTRLNRDVAVKVSAERFSERFEHEARAIASLNHPNICHLYDVGPNYLVMELVEGETLADRIRRGPLPLEEALPIARQIADALDAAHEKGIVHRDLKPGNVKIKPDGTVKVLDFGLAKTGGTPVALSDNSPTLTMAQTQAGIILGTASYMAPEQAKGKPVDKRADIYSFGAVLYEMLTAKRLHNGETTTEVLASVMKEEPQWETVPPQVRRLLQRCLEKDPQKRLRHIGDVMALVDDAPATVQPSAARPARKWLWPSAAALAIVLAVAGWIWLRTPRLTDLPLVRQDVDLGPDIALSAPVLYVTNVVISPDSTRLAYVARIPPGNLKLFTRRLDQPNAIELPGTEGPRGPFFSPDGKWLGFGVGLKLYKISVDGGAAVPLMDLRAPFAGASWGADGIIVAQFGTSLTRIPDSGGGQPTPVTQVAANEVGHTSPQLLPGGKAVLFGVIPTGTTDPDKAYFDVVSLSDHRRKTLVRGGTFPRFVASYPGGSVGHILYTFRGGLYAIPFDTDKLETRGAAVPIVNDVEDVGRSVAGKFDVSQTGVLVYQKAAGASAGDITVQWLDPSGKQQPLLAKPGTYANPRLSPDGKRLALASVDGPNRDIIVYDWQNDRTTKLTFGDSNYNAPVWSPNGQFVVFYSGVSTGIRWARADGSGQPQALTGNENSNQLPWSFSRDGKRLAYFSLAAATGRHQIWTVPVEELNGQLKAGPPERFLTDQFTDAEPAFSPDGRWIAYASDESGSGQEIYVRPFPPPASGQGGKWIVSTQGGQYPVWSTTSNQLFYRTPSGRIMSVTYTVKGDAFVPDKPRAWTENPAAGPLPFDLSPDGKRVVVVTPADAQAAPKPAHEVVFLQNFFDELRRRVPVGK